MPTYHFFLTIRDHTLNTSQYHEKYKYSPLLPAPSTITGAYIRALLRVLDGDSAQIEEHLLPKAVHVAPLGTVYQLYRFKRMHTKVETGKEGGAPEWFLRTVYYPNNKKSSGYKIFISTGTYTVISEMRVHMKFEAPDDALTTIKKALHSMLAVGENDDIVTDYKVEGPYTAEETLDEGYTWYYTRAENVPLDTASDIVITRLWEIASIDPSVKTHVKNKFGVKYAIPLVFRPPKELIFHYTGAPLVRVFEPTTVKVKDLDIIRTKRGLERVPREDNVVVLPTACRNNRRSRGSSRRRSRNRH
ncbi:hypothetical protein [Pyrococcus kukulkanii]|uniref:CRISPR-associated protein Cas5 n=1 Tax=Pyrococcus kukulkanii TaxID=1609559 RepID=A0ABV4T5I3_9EURY